MTLMLQEAKPEVQGVNVRCGTRGDQEGRFVVRFIFGGMGEGWLWGFWSHTCEVSSSCGGHFNALRFHACISLGGGASGGRWLGRRQSQNQREGPHTPTRWFWHSLPLRGVTVWEPELCYKEPCAEVLPGARAGSFSPSSSARKGCSKRFLP